MKPRLPKRQRGMPGAEAFLWQCCEALDRSIPGLRTIFMIAGLIAAAAHADEAANFLFVTGLLFQFAIWFDHWMKKPADQGAP